MDNSNKEWEVLHSEYLIRRPWLTARRDHVRLPNGVENPLIRHAANYTKKQATEEDIGHTT